MSQSVSASVFTADIETVFLWALLNEAVRRLLLKLQALMYLSSCAAGPQLWDGSRAQHLQFVHFSEQEQTDRVSEESYSLFESVVEAWPRLLL